MEMTINITIFWYMTPCRLDLCGSGIRSSRRHLLEGW